MATKIKVLVLILSFVQTWSASTLASKPKTQEVSSTTVLASFIQNEGEVCIQAEDDKNYLCESKNTVCYKTITSWEKKKWTENCIPNNGYWSANGI